MEEKKLVKAIQLEFFKRLDEQTSWGKEQLKKMYLEVQADVLLDLVKPS